MKLAAVISAILALSVTSAMACPFESKGQASAPVDRQLGAASADAPMSQQESAAVTK